MPLTATFTEEMVRGLAPDETTFTRAKEIVRAERLQNLGVSSDGTWLLAECKGSGRFPYQVSADFHDPNHPTLRSNSPSRTMPDKFGIALLLAYLQSPERFGSREPSEELVLKREKKIVQDEKKKTGSAAPRKIARTVQDKRAISQREGLESLERMLVDLVAGGHWLDKSRLEKIERLTKQLNDAYLPAAIHGLRRMTSISKQKDLNEEEKTIHAAEAIAALWAAWRKAHAYLEGRLDDGETQEEADALVEDVIGRPWQINELRERGYVASNVLLYELAFERLDDESRQQRFEISNLVDLGSGSIHQAYTCRPFKGLSQVPEQPSYQSPVEISEAALFPGWVNRRVRWEKGIEQIIENAPADLLSQVHGRARRDFASVIADFRRQLGCPLAPREAVFLLGCERIGKIGDRLVVEDASGIRLELKDRRKDYSNAANLVRAAGMLAGSWPALLVRLFVQPLANTIVGLPLAAVTPSYHLRLGL